MKSFISRDDRYAFFYHLAQVCVYLCLMIILLSSPSHAEDFTAKTLSDQGNITIMEVTGNYDAKKADGSDNNAPRQVIAKEFLKTHKDEYDFLVVYSNFDFQMPETEAKAFYVGVKNDTKGIGQQLFDVSTLFGSSGKLQGMVDMGNVSNIIADPLNPKFEDTLFLLSHEIMHRWGAYVKFKDANGNISTALLGRDLSHWSYLLNGYGSVLYGNQWQDNGNGTFTSLANMKYYSPLDLYLMGVYGKSQVPPMLLIANPGIDPAKMLQTGDTINGTPQYVTIDDIVAAEGERIPASSEAQKTFKTAFIFITAPGTFTGDELYGIEGIRNGWVSRFSILTDGKAIVSVDSAPAENVASNPGTVTPAVTPRTLPPNIEDGVNWLMTSQKSDGSWMDMSLTSERDTAQSVLVLKNFSNALQNYSTGIQWLSAAESGNLDYLSRKIETLANSGQDVTSLVNELVSRQNADGGWGSDKAYLSNPLDTSLALKALSKADYSGQGAISKAIDYLKASQNADKGWGGDDGESTVETTSNVLSAFNKYSNVYQLNEIVTGGIALLLQRQNPDGGFGNSPSTVYDTAIAVSALKELDVSAEVATKAVNYMLGLQSEDGSWYKSAYQTALAVNSVWGATVNPDLSIKTSDITYTPPSVSSLPMNIVVNANISNLGRTDVSQVKIVLYDGAMALGKKIGEQIIAVPGQSSATAQFPITITDGSEHMFYVYVDPENLVQELNKTNNTAMNSFKPASTYDFEILASDIAVSPGVVDIFKDVKISSKVTNKGTLNAYNVQIKYYIDEAGGPFELATATVDIPANSTISNEITWRTNKAGANLPVTVYVDPFNNFTEVSKDNNKATTIITVNGSTEPNLTTSYKDMTVTPNPVNEREGVSISAVVKNDGFSAASNITVNCYKGVPGVDGVLIGSRSIPSLSPGENGSVSFDWTNIAESGEKIIYIKVDPDNQITETSKDDNDAFVILNILSLPDLALSTNSIVFTPLAPKDGDTVSISVTVQNKGQQAALNVMVRAYEGNTLIGSQVIPSITGNSFASASMTYNTAGKKGAHQITVVVDPDNAIVERSKDNNSASRTFGVQDTNLWLTEQYISPNGDGVKDSTQMFFSLDLPQTVKVIVVNEKGETVRMFSGSEFENIPGGNITWDGLNDKGTVAADGQYQVKVVDMNNNILGSLLVIVDNNRSLLTDAIGTEYLYSKNVTCGASDIKWMPDESQMLALKDKTVVLMSPEGQDIIPVAPDWKDWWWKSYPATYPSNDGSKIVSVVQDSYFAWLGQTSYNLIVSDRDGNELTQFNLTLYNPEVIAWSPDNNHFSAMSRWSYNSSDYSVYSITGAKVPFFVNGVKIFNFSANPWSPDGARISFGTQSGEVYIANADGTNMTKLGDVGLSVNSVSWLTENKLAVQTSGDKRFLIDISIGNLISLGMFSNKNSIALSPDGKTVAYADINNLNLLSQDGSSRIIYEAENGLNLDSNLDANADNNVLIWSKDGKKIAFVNVIEKLPGPDKDCGGYNYSNTQTDLIIVDMEAGTNMVLKSDKAPCSNGSRQEEDQKVISGWFDDNEHLLISSNFGIYVINVVSGNRTYLLKGSVWSDGYDYWEPYMSEAPIISPFENYISWRHDPYIHPEYNNCDGYGNGLTRSLLNLTAYLQAVKNLNQVTLRGIAADKNFGGYKLEYSDVASPEQWNYIVPLSEAPVVDDVLAAWIPPYEGTFYVKLTAWDKAGNTAVDKRRVSWGLSSSITNVYKTLEAFSPNNDGVKDTVELHYRVIEPVHLEFAVYDGNNNIISASLKDYTSPVNDYFTWDGRDSTGNVVPDGEYTIKVFDYEFFVVVDNTPPKVDVNFSGLYREESVDNGTGGKVKVHIPATSVDLKGYSVDINLKAWRIEKNNGEGWQEVTQGSSSLAATDEDGNINYGNPAGTILYGEDNIDEIVMYQYRLAAEDFAGNKASLSADSFPEGIAIYEVSNKDKKVLDPFYVPAESGDIADTYIRLRKKDLMSDVNTPASIFLRFFYTVKNELANISLKYKSDDSTQWADIVLPPPAERNIEIKFDLGLVIQKLLDGREVHIKIEMMDIMGREFVSNKIVLNTKKCRPEGKHNIKVDRQQEPVCGMINNSKIGITAEGFNGTVCEDETGNEYSIPILVGGVGLYLKYPDGKREEIKKVTYDAPQWQVRISAEMDTSQLQEGKYVIEAESFGFSWTWSEILWVDRVLPTARITYPSNSQMVCPIKISDPKSDKFIIPVEGIAADANSVDRYEIYYGIGENPVAWTQTVAQKTAKHSNGSISGQLGRWDVTELKDADFSLKLKVVDGAGNASCDTVSFSVDTATEIVNLSKDKNLFSPNGDGVLDDVNISYQIDEFATVDVEVFQTLQADDGSYSLDYTAWVTDIAYGLQHMGGTEGHVWDGYDYWGAAVPDGKYGVAVYAKDSCGNTAMKWILVEVDNTPPSSVIVYPGPSDPLGNIVEVKGTADDLHFKDYIIEAGQGDNPDVWNIIASNTVQVKDKVLGNWNTFGLLGKWTLRLTATDTVGNTNTSLVTVDLGIRKNLIKDLSVAPKLFSPNNDGKLDSTSIKYELTDTCLINIDMTDSAGTLKKTYTSVTPSGGTYTYVWDGKDNAGNIVPDDVYTVKLSAALSYNLSVMQSESLTVAVDSTQPVIDIKKPVENSYIKTEVTVNGTVSDKNLQEYSINYIGDSGTVSFDKGNQNREDFVFGILNDLPEGNYTLNIKTKDLAENSNEKNIVFTIDRTPPKVALETPKEGEYYGADKNIINISGSIVEKNLETFSLRYGLGDNPSQWTDLISGNTVPATPQLLSWKVGKNDGIPDGVYTLSLYAKDKAGSTGEAKVKIIVDNTQPEVAITSLNDGNYIKAGSDIKGTATDPNFDRYTVEFSEGQCSSAFKWAIIKTSTAPVNDGLLVKWQMVPPDGDYCVRLSAMDKAGNKAESKINVKVDTHPPAAPVLSGKIENKSVVKLTWPQNTETDVSGYDLYRDGQKINAALINGPGYSEQGLKEGTFTYTLKAVDFAGNESALSNEIKLKVDLIAPDARIASPRDGSRSGSLIDIKGTAYSSDDFKQYRVYIGQGQTPSTWSLIRTSPLPVTYGLLAQWDTIGLPGGMYSIKLEAEDLSGNINLHQVTVTIDNTPPAAPSLVSAAPNSSDVTLTWQANAESDLAGYLLYSNDQLANVSGIMIGDLKPYLIAGTTYLDKARPDGKFKYYLMAMDQAGNLSDQSNSLEVNIDTHPPHVTIVEPADRAKLENKTLVKAESPDLDISSVQFQYKIVQDAVWINLGAPTAQSPYTAYLSLKEAGLPYGDYHVRAVATDTGGKTDASPSYITITFTDITPPSTPLALKALTKSKDVTLTWTANTEPDLNGYNVYRTLKGTKTRVNPSIVKEAAYQDMDLADGDYTYEVTAVDTFGNESKASNKASAKIYALLLIQPYTPTAQKIIKINGNNAGLNTFVEISVDSGSGPASQGVATPDSQGIFEFEMTLSAGENRITAQATDSAGNISRNSEMVVIVYNESPSTPTGLAASVENYNVNLAWNANTEPDLSGYNMYRNGEKVNAPISVTTGTATVSSSYYNPPSYAFDGNPDTYWESPYSYGPFSPAWWELALPSTELINQVAINWGSGTDYQGNTILYAGKDFEIQVWSGYAWITQVKVAGNNSIDNIFDFNPSYRTDKVRLYIMDTTDTNNSKQVRISEVKIVRDNLVTQPSYADSNLHDHKYNYKVSAVDYYGFESGPSDAVEAAVGDVFPPSAPLSLTAEASGSNVILNWTANLEPDLKGYNVYRNTQNGWIKLNTAIVTVNAYTDFNLKNGAYTYRVAAMDEADNEGLPSNEASADVYVSPPDTPPQLIPEIYFPTISGMPVVSDKDKADIAGSTDPGSVVELFWNGSSMGKTTAAQEDALQSFALGNNVFYMEVSPDGKKLAYKLNGSMWIKDLISGSDTMITQNLYSFRWSSDGEKLAYEFRDDNWNRRIGIYDANTGETAPLTGDEYVYERQPSWSFDGNRVAFRSDRAGEGYEDIWVKDLVEGSYLQVTSYSEVYGPQISPDGKKVAYLSFNWDTECDDVYVNDINKKNAVLVDASCLDETNLNWSPDSNKLALEGYNSEDYSNIVLFDMNTGARTLLATPVGDYYDNAWSPDGNKLAFSSYTSDGNSNIIVLDANTSKQTQIAAPGYDNFYPVWSPDGKAIAFERWDSNDSNSIVITSADGLGQEKILEQYLDRSEYLAWTKAGAVAYAKGNIFDISYLKGHFSFKDVPLDLGENVFHAIATDISGNASPSSDEISVTFSTNLMPDLETTADDIFVYPQYPKPGEEAAVYVTVRNKGGADADDVEADIYLLDSEGNLGLVQSAEISHIAAASSEVVEINLNGLKAGANKFFAVIDPQDKIKELDENNNYAEKEVIAGNLEGVLMSTVLDSDRYQADKEVKVAARLDNAGIEKDATLTITVEDKDGYAVVSLYSADLHIPYAFHKDMELSWNTGNTFAGQYRVHAVLKDASGIIAENVTSFTIQPDLNMDLSLTSDKSNYAAFDNVSFNVGLKNNGKNYIVPELNVKMKLTDSNNNLLVTDDRILTNLMPNVSNAINSTWNAGLNSPGIYNASVEIYIDNGLVSTKTTAFTINPTSLITGEMAVAPAVVIHGNTVRIGYQVRNSGNTGISSLPLKVLVIDPESGAVINTGENVTDLPVNGSQAGEFVFLTQDYGLKTYTAILQSIYQNNTKNLASTSFTVKDGIPPTVNIIFPLQGSYYNSKLEISVTAADDISGVDKVEYRTENGTWKLLPLSNPSAGRYSTTWALVKADEGNKTLSFRATDRAGNISQPVSVAFTVDLTPPEPPVIISPEDNTTVVSEVADIKGTAEPGSTVAMYSDNVLTTKADPSSGEFVFEGMNLALGKNEFVFTVSDTAGNVSEPAAYALNFMPLAAGVAPDRTKYNPYETVAVTSTMQNISSGYTLQDLAAKVSIFNGPGQTVFTDEKQVQTLVPGQFVDLKAYWDTSNSAKGIYSVKLEILKDTIIQNSSSMTFEILGSSQTGEGITGTIMAQPDPVSQGKDETITYSITNKGNEDVGGLDVKVLIMNLDTQEIKNTFNNNINLPMDTTITGSFVFNTSNLAPRIYSVALQISTSSMIKPKEAATAVFEVKPGLEITKTIPDVINMLVWLNGKCHEHEANKNKEKDKYLPGSPTKGCQHHDDDEEEEEDDDNTCLRLDLLEKVLMESAEDYFIVYSKKDFQAELRDPYYTDVLILGDHSRLDDRFEDELRERVYSGMGLISSLWLNYGESKDRIFGVKYKGKLSGSDHVVNTVPSPVTANGIISVKGDAERVETMDGTTIAAWIKKVKEYKHIKKDEFYPAIVLNEYGNGRAIYYAFDLGLTLDDTNDNSLADMIKNSITYVHRPMETTTFYPNSFIPFQMQFKNSGGASDLRIKETYPVELKLYDPIAGEWITDNPWVMNIRLEPNGPNTLRFYVFTPDKAGTYTLQTEVGYMDNGDYTFGQNLGADIMISKDAVTAASDAITALSELTVSGKDRAKIKDAIRYIKNVQKRIIVNNKDIEKNIRDVLKAIEALFPVTSADVSAARLMLDELLRIWEGAGDIYDE